MAVELSPAGRWWRAARPRAAAGVAAAALLLTWLGAGLAVTNTTGWRELWASFTFGTLVVAVTFTLVGGTVSVRAPGHPVGWLLLAIGADAAVSLAATQYATYAGPGRAGTAAAWVGSWSGS